LKVFPYPDEAFTAFVQNVGCDLSALLRRDPAEIARLNEVADILIEFDLLGDGIPAKRRYLEKLLWTGQQHIFLNVARVGVSQKLHRRRLVRLEFLACERRRFDTVLLRPTSSSSSEH
jgi:hypothetical protein